MKNASVRAVTTGAMIAALYVLLTEICTLLGMSSGIIQFRISEALCILAVFTPVAAPALFCGCVLSNILAGGIPMDVLFGSLATLLGALGGRLLRRTPYLAPLPTVFWNVVIIGPLLKFVYDFPGSLGYFMLTVGIGEVVCAWIGGILLYRILKPHSQRLF